ncbi:hypothetical protein KY385_02235 [Candidatus Parcubacteria bacterium]|nr:hypothetical protein [Candidatus Parcubacteria bacterium]
MSKHVYDKKKWMEMPLFDQMGNISAEVGRALRAKQKGDQRSLEGAFYRGLDLLNATIQGLVERKSPRFREVLIARDQFCEAILIKKDDPKLDEYFTQFALAARKDK